MPATTLECIPLYEDADRVTGVPTIAVAGKTFVRVSANKVANANISIAPATAAGPTLGVAANSAIIGEVVTVITEGIVPVTAAGTITAGAEIEVGASGQAAVLAAGKRVGLAITDATVGLDCYVKLNV